MRQHTYQKIVDFFKKKVKIKLSKFWILLFQVKSLYCKGDEVNIFIVKNSKEIKTLILRVIAIILALPLFLPGQTRWVPEWTPDKRITFTSGDCEYHPQVICSGDTVHLTWYRNWRDSLGPRDDIYYKRSLDAGNTWGPDILITKQRIPSHKFSPDITISKGIINIVWAQFGGGHPDALLICRSTDGGDNWGSIDTIYRGPAHHPDLVSRGDTIFLICMHHDNRLAFTKSTNNGRTWQLLQIVTEANQIPRIAVNGRYLISTFEANDSIARTIFSIRSSDRGSTWIQRTPVIEIDSAMSQFAAICADQTGKLHVVWLDSKFGGPLFDILYSCSRDTGATWDKFTMISDRHMAEWFSDIVCERDNIHVVWPDARDDPQYWTYDLYYRLSTDLGISWQEPVRLTKAPYNSSDPAFALAEWFLHLVWTDARDESLGRWGEIYYKRKSLVTGIADLETMCNDKFFVFPNPSAREVYFKYFDEHIEVRNLKIYDVKGSLIRVLNFRRQGGVYQAIWDKRDGKGRKIGPGIYFICFENRNGGNLIKKIVSLR